MVSQLVVLDADALTFGHPYNKRLPTVIPIADLIEVSMYDQRRPERVRFKCKGRFGVRRYVLRCDEATDAVLLVGALRALTNARRGVLVYAPPPLYAIDATVAHARWRTPRSQSRGRRRGALRGANPARSSMSRARACTTI